MEEEIEAIRQNQIRHGIIDADAIQARRFKPRAFKVTEDQLLDLRGFIIDISAGQDPDKAASMIGLILDDIRRHPV